MKTLVSDSTPWVALSEIDKEVIDRVYPGRNHCFRFCRNKYWLPIGVNVRDASMKILVISGKGYAVYDNYQQLKKYGPRQHDTVVYIVSTDYNHHVDQLFVYYGGLK